MSMHSPSRGDRAPARPSSAPVVPPSLYWPSWTDTPALKIDLSRFDSGGNLKVHGRKVRRQAAGVGRS